MLVFCTYIFIFKCFAAFAFNMVTHAVHVIFLGVTCILHCFLLMVFIYYRVVFLKVGLICIIHLLEMVELTSLLYGHC